MYFQSEMFTPWPSSETSISSAATTIDVNIGIEGTNTTIH